MSRPLTVDPTVARALGHYAAARAVADQTPPRPADSGLINATWLIGEAWVLQRLNPMFGGAVNEDIAALLPTLAAGGVPVPALLRSDAGATWVEVDGAAWRVLTQLPGRTLHSVPGAPHAAALGAALGAVHTALIGTAHTFAAGRAHIHDTDRHLDQLSAALNAFAGHRLYAQVAPIAEALTAMWAAFGPLPDLPQRIGHGDPKVSNFRFDADGRVVGVLDLDTLGWMTIDVELGDALRSWCSTRDEDAHDPAFDPARFNAAVAGYLSAARAWISAAEVASIAAAPLRIAIELAARFARDALAEDYFGWDATRFATSGDHNLVRARNQLTLARDVARQRAALARAVGVAHAAAAALG